MAITFSINGELKEALETSSKVIETFYQSVRSNEKGNVQIEVPNATVDLEVSLPAIDNFSFLYLVTDQAIIVKLHPVSGSVTPPASLTNLEVKKLLVLYGTFTKVYISNSSGNVANVRIASLGTEVPA